MAEPDHLSWDAQTYHEVSDPQRGWADAVIERIAFRGDEIVLDAGCGSGDVTRMLAERVPDGRVIGVDGSAEMVALARDNLADLGERVRLQRADLLELELAERVDLAFSNAVFHWVADHDLLFARLAAVMAPGGRLEAQCGGRGNIEAATRSLEQVALREPYAAFLGGFRRRWRFATAEATAARLARAGFVEIATWLEPRPVRLPVGGPAERFMSACVLRLHLQRLPEDLRAPFATEVAELVADEDGVAHLDYVRLNMSARRPG